MSEHYRQGQIECIDAIKSALSTEEYKGFLKANIIKYIWRCNHKGNHDDLVKAEYYLKLLLEA